MTEHTAYTAAPGKRSSLSVIFFLSYFCVFATSPLLVHLHTQMHDELYASASVRPESFQRNLKLVVAEFLLSVITREERDDGTDASPHGRVILKEKAAEVTESTHLKLRYPSECANSSLDAAALPMTGEVRTTVEHDNVTPGKAFYPLYVGLSPPSLSYS